MRTQIAQDFAHVTQYPEDGDCLFHFLADVVFGQLEADMYMRERIVGHMRENIDDYAAYLDMDGPAAQPAAAPQLPIGAAPPQCPAAAGQPVSPAGNRDESPSGLGQPGGPADGVSEPLAAAASRFATGVLGACHGVADVIIYLIFAMVPLLQPVADASASCVACVPWTEMMQTAVQLAPVLASLSSAQSRGAVLLDFFKEVVALYTSFAVLRLFAAPLLYATGCRWRGGRQTCGAALALMQCTGSWLYVLPNLACDNDAQRGEHHMEETGLAPGRLASPPTLQAKPIGRRGAVANVDHGDSAEHDDHDNRDALDNNGGHDNHDGRGDHENNGDHRELVGRRNLTGLSGVQRFCGAAASLLQCANVWLGVDDAAAQTAPPSTDPAFMDIQPWDWTSGMEAWPAFFQGMTVTQILEFFARPENADAWWRQCPGKWCGSAECVEDIESFHEVVASHGVSPLWGQTSQLQEFYLVPWGAGSDWLPPPPIADGDGNSSHGDTGRNMTIDVAKLVLSVASAHTAAALPMQAGG